MFKCLVFCTLLQIQASLLAAESNLAEAKKQHDQMLESKQLELSRHLKELSQKNDQVNLKIFYLVFLYMFAPIQQVTLVGSFSGHQ